MSLTLKAQGKKRTITKGKQTHIERHAGFKPIASEGIEIRVLGGMLTDKTAAYRCIGIGLSEECFTDSFRKIAFRAIKKLDEEGVCPDPLLVKEKCLQLLSDFDSFVSAEDFDSHAFVFADEVHFLSGIISRCGYWMNSVASTVNIELDVRILLQKQIRRTLVDISTKVIAHCFELGAVPDEAVDSALKSIEEIKLNTLKKPIESTGVLVKEAVEILEQKVNNPDKYDSQFLTAYTELDHLLSINKSDLVILAGRPGMGKTLFLLCMARNMALLQKKRVLVFSLEMSKLQLTYRLISMETGIEMEDIKRANLSPKQWETITTGLDGLATERIAVCDFGDATLSHIRSSAIRFKSKASPDEDMIAFIDYIGLMKSLKTVGNRQQEIGQITRGLKAMAKELDIPVVALSQLNRGVEQRGGDKRPILPDLRDSGDIEQDADIVAFLYRPEYYGFTEDEDGLPTEGKVEVILSKNRHGGTGTIALEGDLGRNRITNSTLYSKHPHAGQDLLYGHSNIETYYKKEAEETPELEDLSTILNRHSFPGETKLWDDF